jgi:hypothetical protein
LRFHKDLRIDGSGIASEVESLSIGEDGSARDSLAIDIDSGDSRGTRCLIVSIATSASNSDGGRICGSVIAGFSEEDGHGHIVSGRIASSSAAQISESLSKVNEFSGLRGGANSVVNSHLLLSVIVVNGS